MDTRLILEQTAAPNTQRRATSVGVGTGAASNPALSKSAGGPSGFSFSDFLDIINPLQHIPIISSLYRSLSGDTIGPGPRIIGDGLFGGPIGLVASILDAGVQQVTGEDLGTQALTFLGVEPKEDKAPTAARAPTLRHGTLSAQAPDGRPGLAEEGTNAAVSDWARGELTYRNALAANALAVDTKKETFPRSPEKDRFITAMNTGIAQYEKTIHMKQAPGPSRTSGSSNINFLQ